MRLNISESDDFTIKALNENLDFEERHKVDTSKYGMGFSIIEVVNSPI